MGRVAVFDAWVVVTLAVLAAIITNIFVGWRQMVEASGSRGQLVWVATCLGFIQILPLVAWATFVSMRGNDPVQFAMACGAAFLNLLLMAGYFLPPVRLRGTKEKLPRVADEPFLARVAELADKMHVPTPIVRLWPSISSSQRALAFAGTIQAPQIVVTDGILLVEEYSALRVAITSALCSMPVFSASAPMSLSTTSICWAMKAGSTGTTPCTPTVFWAVRAVIAVAAKAFMAVTALMSAWIPAPPPESDPATISTRPFMQPAAGSRR
jgi:hypothetical protein